MKQKLFNSVENIGYLFLIVLLVIAMSTDSIRYFFKPSASAAPGDGHMLLFWDGGAAPSGWTCVSCTSGDAFYQLFPRGNDTYGATGGVASHSHTATTVLATTNTAATSEAQTGATVSDNSHAHTVSNTISSESNLPPYRTLQVIRSDNPGEPATIPNGAIGFFESSTFPTDWTSYSSQDGFYPYGENTAGTTGGSATHSHTLTIGVGAATGVTQAPRTNGPQVQTAAAGHSHSASGNSDNVSNEPPFIEVVFGQATANTTSPDGLYAMWDDDQPTNWTKQSGSGGSFEQRFFKGATTFGTTGGNTSHVHADQTVVTGLPDLTLTRRSGGAGASSLHTHNIDISDYSSENLIPPYRDVIIAKRVPQPTVEQSAYRFYNNQNSTDVGVPLAAQDTTATTPRQGKTFRLRLSLHIATADLDAGNKNFKLQFAIRSGTCDPSFSGETYSDVVSGSGAIQFADNTTPADGDSLTTNANDPAHGLDTMVAQTYEESNNFTSTSAITIGQDGFWDFALKDVSAPASTAYCFRTVFADGSQLNSYSVVPEIITDDGNGHMLLLWDGVSIPSGWTCVSCNSSDELYQKFIRGNGSYGATGGADTHSHTASFSIGAVSSQGIEVQAGTGVASGAHGHTIASSSVDSASNLPQYRQLQIIRADTSGVPTTLPAGSISYFDAAVPAGWTQYAAQDGQYIRGENSIGTTGGSNTHSNPTSGSLSASTGQSGARTNGSTISSALNGHTHSITGNINSANNEPPFIEAILGKLSASSTVPLNIIVMWDGPIPGSWTDVSSTGQPFNQRFVKPATAYGTTGGSATHSHTDSIVSTSAPSITGIHRSGTGNADGAHTHAINVTGISNESHLPPYVDVIFAKLGVLNTPPNVPTNLNQTRPSDLSSISVGGFSNGGQVRFIADATDTDNPDSLQLCVEAQPIGTPFTNSPTQCGASVLYSGSTVSPVVTITGLSEGASYHWQAQIKDGGGGVSAWISFGANLESSADFTNDSVAPSGTVYDGSTVSVDIDYNDGSLDTIHANWAISDATSGINFFEIAVGTTAGSNDVSGWTNIGTASSQTLSSLVLETSQVYYVSIRAYDNAGNDQTISSDGQLVAPSLSFTTSGSGVQFNNLNNSNSFTDTQTTTLTTSTNAKNGYEIRAYASSLMQNIYADTIGMFNGGTYASPDAWLGGDTGFGYTSNDPIVQGSNIFNPGICAGGGSGPCFAPYSQTAPGDIVADNESTISGTPINNESFIITHRVTTTSSQQAGDYQTTLIFSASAKY